MPKKGPAVPYVSQTAELSRMEAFYLNDNANVNVQVSQISIHIPYTQKVKMTSDYLASPRAPPELNIPSSSSTVKVSIINTTSTITLPMGLMVQPEVGKYHTVTCPCFAFLVEHSSGRKLVFDLGIRKDWENSSPFITNMVKKHGWGVKVDKDVATILEENGVRTGEVEAVIWSHYHWDHTGDPTTFPSTTALIVGPGFKDRFPNAYPTVPKSPVKEDAWAGRELREVSFDSLNLKIGRFYALDFFGDGSFYLLDTPGHLLGHICGLARTTPDSFIFMGGDAAHHAGEIRPSEYIPLPRRIKLDPNVTSFPHICPGEILMQHIHPEKSAIKPFYKAADGFNEVSAVADWTIEGVSEFDADERVFVVVAHDASLLEVVDFFPKAASNDWKAKHWGQKGHWRFLGDFVKGINEATAAGKL